MTIEQKREYIKQKLEHRKTLLQLFWVATLSDIAGTVAEFKTNGFSKIFVLGGLIGVFFTIFVLFILVSYGKLLKSLEK